MAEPEMAKKPTPPHPVVRHEVLPSVIDDLIEDVADSGVLKRDYY